MGQYDGGRGQGKSDIVNSKSADLDFFPKITRSKMRMLLQKAFDPIVPCEAF